MRLNFWNMNINFYNDRNGYERPAAKFEWIARPVALDNSYKK